MMVVCLAVLTSGSGGNEKVGGMDAAGRLVYEVVDRQNHPKSPLKCQGFLGVIVTPPLYPHRAPKGPLKSPRIAMERHLASRAAEAAIPLSILLSLAAHRRSGSCIARSEFDTASSQNASRLSATGCGNFLLQLGLRQ